MADTVEQLQPADFDEIIDHLDEAYGRHKDASFRTSLSPVSTDPADRSTHRRYAIRREGRIAASVGVFSYDVCIGDGSLRLAGIGSVSTSPAHRGQGLMSRLMSHVARLLPEQGYHVAWLVGRRHRYRRFGWEIAGCDCYYDLTRIALAEPSQSYPLAELELFPLSQRRDALEPLVRLRRSQSFHVEGLPFQNRRHDRTHVAADRDGRPLGYLILDAGRETIVELVGETPSVERQMVQAALELDGRERIGLCLPAFSSSLHRGLAADAAPPVLRPSGSWQVFDWRATLLALLRARHRLQPLLPGRVVIEIEGAARLALRVGDDGAWVEPTGAPADFAADGPCMTRLLLGHLPPRFVVTLPPSARQLEAWCPLSISMPTIERC